MKRLIYTLILNCLVSATLAQQASLEMYVRMGLESNLSLKQELFKLQQAYDALEQSKGLFLPSVTLQADYTYADGGRQINLPLGDLLNPVYSTLNQLTSSQRFPQLENQKILFNPNNYHDTRIVTTLPLINAEIYYNHALKKEAISQQQAEIRVFKRLLIKNIKVAYYQIINAQSAVNIYQNAALLLKQNYGMTMSLIKNGKALKGNAVRLSAEINNNEARLTAARDNKQVAVAYFNFLLNHPLTDSVDLTNREEPDTQNLLTPQGDSATIERRDELAVLKSGIKQTSLSVANDKAAYLPTLSTWINTGYQGYDFKFNGDTRYVFGGISLKWNLFNGGQDKSRVREAKASLLELETKYDETSVQLHVQLIQAQKELNTANGEWYSAVTNVKNFEEYYRETKVRYGQGLVLLVELNDAFTQLINGKLAAELSKTNVKIKQAELEQAAGSYPL